VNSGEYKVMGLAPYGEPRYVAAIKDHLIEVRDDGSLWMNMEYFEYPHGLRMTGDGFDRLFGGRPRQPESPLTQREMDLARSIQDITEEVMLKMAQFAHHETGMKHLCLAGGGQGDRVAAGPDGIRSARARRPVDHRRCTVAGDAVGDESQDQVPRVVPSVCAVGPARACRRVLRARPGQSVHAARRGRGEI